MRSETYPCRHVVRNAPKFGLGRHEVGQDLRERFTNSASDGVVTLRSGAVTRNLHDMDAVEDRHQRALCSMDDCFNVARFPPHWLQL